MAVKVIMPKQGLQMTEGKITKWFVPEGGTAVEGQPLFEIETDKLTIEIDAPASGTLLKHFSAEGETVPITRIIGAIGTPGDDISGIVRELESQGSETAPDAEKIDGKILTQTKTTTDDAAISDRIFSTPRARAKAEAKGVDLRLLSGSGPESLVVERDIPDITPLAAKMASGMEAPLGSIRGSGPNGRITKADLEAFAAGRPAAAAISDREGRDTRIKMTGMRKAISERMTRSVSTMAQANHRMKVDMTETVKLREELKSLGKKISYTDILVKIVSRALMEHRIVNSTLTDDGILVHNFVNMGIAVALEDGLIVPVIKDAETLSLEQISARSAELAEKARTGRLLPDEYAGGTFTITNLGMYDVDEFTAIVNPPESAILAIGKIGRVPVAMDDGSVAVRPMMTMSLTYDHRIVDGAPAAAFLQRIKQLLQNPYLLI